MVLARHGDGFLVKDVKSTLPSDFTGHNQTSEVRVSASGKLVYASNRGFDSIAVFTYQPGSETVELKAVEPSRGSEPRDFIEAVAGKLLLVANQDSDTIASFAVDEDVPSLTFVSTRTAPTPVCLRLL
jgi:6-phosphogluconolactonase